MGISYDSCDRGQIIGNNFSGFVVNANSYGIEVPSSSNTSISGNTVDGNGCLLYGITLDGATASSNVAIVGNTIKNLAPQTTVTGAGIYLHSPGGLTDITIAANTMTMPNTTYACGILSGLSIAKLTVTGNTIQGNNVGAYAGIQLFGATQSTIVGNVLTGFARGCALISGTYANLSVTGNSADMIPFCTYVGGTVTGGLVVHNAGDDDPLVKSATYSTGISERTIIATGTWTLTLTTLKGQTKTVVNTGVGTITCVASSGTITGTASLASGARATYVCDGTNWYQIA